MALLKNNHPQRDFFVPDMFDSLGASFKDDMASMEHPIFSLSKKKDLRCLEYRKENITISITPSMHGLPTIFDKDILLYCASLLMTEINAGRTPPKTLRVSCRDMLISTNKRTDGDDYIRLKQSLDRLQGVSIKTNIRTNNREVTRGFGVFDSYEVVESSKVKNRMVRLEITLSDWFYNSIIGKEVLTINRDYFRLGKPMERRLYEIARKHCGRQHSWSIGLVPLMDKTGSTSSLRLFRSRMKIIAKDNHLPDYSMSIDDNDKVTFYYQHTHDEQSSLPFDNLPNISQKTLITAARIVEEADTGWDFNTLHSEFTESLVSGSFKPNNANGAFINFVKKKTQNLL